MPAFASRRSFTKKILAGAASLALSPTLISCQNTRQRAKDSLGVALVGLGYYSTDLLAPALQLTKHCRLAGIVTGSPDKAERWQRQRRLPDTGIYDYASFDRIADNPDIDAVYVVLPTSMHAEYAIRAAKAGKHVWCEKPMAVTAADCDAMIQACAGNRVKLAIGYRMRHEPLTQEIIRYGKERAFGKVREVKASAGYFDSRSDHWKQKKSMGGGAMYDMGVYALQAARYASGEEPSAVTARHSAKRPEIYTEVDETTHFQLEFPSGATADCATSLGAGMNSLHVACENGWYELSPFQAYGGIRGTTSKGGVLDKTIPNQQAKQMDDDALSILQDQPMLVPGEEGRRDIRVVEAICQAAKEGRRVAL